MNSIYTIKNQPLLRILVVEDDSDQQLLFGYSIREKMPQVGVTFAENSEEALTYLDTVCNERPIDFPNIVLLDLYLPELWHGCRALVEIRARYPRLPVIVVSHGFQQEVVDKCYDLGAHSFLVKPHSLESWERQFRKLGDYWLDTVTLSRGC